MHYKVFYGKPFLGEFLFCIGKLMILLVASIRDSASVNIMRQILKNYPFSISEEKFQGNSVYISQIGGKTVKLALFNEELVYAQNIIGFFPQTQLVIFISKHSSASGKPTLSVHTPGNLGAAELGGISRKVSISPANAMKVALKTMNKLVEEERINYEVSYECTHHGPSLDVPAMFAELGSSPKNWGDQKAAEIVAHAVMESVQNFEVNKCDAALGIGGPHYNEKFTKIALKDEASFSHIIPKYAIPIIDDEILRQCVERTLGKVELAFLDWKGMKSEDRQKIIKIVDGIGLNIRKV